MPFLLAFLPSAFSFIRTNWKLVTIAAAIVFALGGAAWVVHVRHAELALQAQVAADKVAASALRADAERTAAALTGSIADGQAEAARKAADEKGIENVAPQNLDPGAADALRLLDREYH